MNPEHFPFAIGDTVIIEIKGTPRFDIKGSIMGFDETGITIKDGFTHAHWVPWRSIRRVEALGEERRIVEIALALARPDPIRLPTPGTVDTLPEK